MPAQYPGMSPGAPQYPGMPQGPGVQVPGVAPYPGMPQALGMPNYAGMQPPGLAPGMPQGIGGIPGPVANPFGQAQQALAGAGGMVKAMKYAFIGLGVLGVVAGVVLVFVVDVVTGVSVAGAGVVMAGVALFVLPQFTGMLGNATAMVDGFAAKAQLAQTGIPANGRLLQVEQTGRLVNFNPEIRAVVEVQHPQLGVYQTQTTAIVPQIAIPRAQPGAPVQVRIHPQNPHEIALVF
jgi:hypothetical protein